MKSYAMIRRAGAVVTTMLLAACQGSIADPNDGGSDPVDGGTRPGPPGVLTVAPINWNPLAVPVSEVAVVAELDDATVLLGHAGATVLVAGTVAASDASVTEWRSAGVIPAADGSGSWLVALDGAGTLHRLRARSSFDAVSDLYGLAMDPVASFADLGHGMVGFGLGAGIAVANGTTVTRYDDMSLTTLAGGGGRAAGAGNDAVHVFDPGTGQEVSYALAGARFVAFDRDAHLVTATDHAVYVESDDGSLVAVFDDESHTIRALVASGSDAAHARVWFAIGTELAALQGDSVAVTSGLGVDATGTLLPSPSGDAWYVSNGSVARYAAQATTTSDEQAWQTNVFPAYTRACSACHSHDGVVNGRAPIELTTYEQWRGARAAIDAYVGAGTPLQMPPPGNLISPADKDAIVHWASMTP